MFNASARWFYLALVANSMLAVSGWSDHKEGDGPAHGQTVIPGTGTWDIETNKTGDVMIADVWWEQQSEKEQFLTPLNGAGITLIGQKAFEKISRQDLAALKYSDKKIAYDRLAPGTVVALRTRGGNIAKLKVIKYRELHDFSFAAAKLMDKQRRNHLKIGPNIKNYNIELEWVIYRE